MKLSQGAAALCLAAALTSLGCGSFTAPIRRTVARPGMTARVESASARHTNEVRVAFVVERAAPGLKLLQASVSAGSEQPCSGFVAPLLSRSGAPSVSEPLKTNERIVLEFPSEAMDTLVAEAPRLDLLVESKRGTHRCIPLELAEGRRRLEWGYDQRFTIGLDVSLEGFTNWNAPVSSLVGFVPTFGAWVGRFRLEIGAGIGGAGCTDSFCPIDQEAESKVDYTTVFPLHAGIEAPVFEVGEFSFGVGARYRAVKLAADTYEGRQRFWAHGPVLAPYFAAMTPQWTEAKLGGSRLGLIGLEVPLGYTLAENGEDAFSIGFNVRSFFTSF